MLNKLLGKLWRGSPVRVRRFGVWLVEPRFTVTAGAGVLDAEGRVLLCKHVFRRGSGWGIPGGFLERGEQPEEAIRRELREEAALAVEPCEARLVSVRTLPRVQQVEMLFLARPRRAAEARAASAEVSRLGWFAPDALPPELSRDPRGRLRLALESATPARE